MWRGKGTARPEMLLNPIFSCSGIIELSHMLDYQCIYLKVQKNSLLSVIISKIFEWASDFYCLGFHT